LAERVRDLPRARRARRAFVWLRRSGVAATLGAVLLLGWGFSERLQKDEAERQQRTLEAVVQFQRDWLSSANPEKRGEAVRVVDVMKEAVQWLNEGALKDDPPVGAAVRGTIGDTLRSLGKLKEAESLLEEALRIRTELFPSNHPGVAQSRYELALLRHDQALALLDRGKTAEADAKFTDAQTLHKQALQSYPTPHPARFQNLAALGLLYNEWGRYADAEPVLSEAVDVARAHLKDRRQHIAATLYNLAISLGGQDKFEQSALRTREALDCKAFAEGDPATGRCLLQLAWCMENLGKRAMARESYREGRENLAEAKESYRKTREIFLAHNDQDRIDASEAGLQRLRDEEQRLVATARDPTADAETARYEPTPTTAAATQPAPAAARLPATGPTASREPAR
jgi:tetratricopeptide (TPR) repeat protein